MTETFDMAVDFRATMSRLATGVSVITTRSGSTPIGMTASAVSALSLDPLQLLVCIGNHLYTRTAIAEHGRFAVNVLGRTASTWRGTSPPPSPTSSQESRPSTTMACRC